MTTRLSDLTTLRVGGPARELVVAEDEAALVDAVRTADLAGTPVLVLAGGSNVLVGDDGFDGTVVLVRSTGVRTESDSCGGAWVSVAAGESWDGLVARAVRDLMMGLVQAFPAERGRLEVAKMLVMGAAQPQFGVK